MSALSTADLTEQNEKAQYQATRLASLAVRALIEEAELTPNRPWWINAVRVRIPTFR